MEFLIGFLIILFVAGLFLSMWFLKLVIQLITLFGGLLFGVSHGELSWLWFWYWVAYAIVNIAVVAWRMMDPGYDVKEDLKNAYMIAKKCPKCRSKLPSYFTTKCPYCTADLG